MRIALSKIQQIANARNSIVKTNRQIYFCAQKPNFDSFTKRKETKEAILQDNTGNIIKSKIEPVPKTNQEIKNATGATKKVGIIVNDLVYGECVYSKDDVTNSIWVNKLNTKTYAKNKGIKGVGTELLKYVAQESINEGFDGRIALLAMHTPSPLVFYYKNNFVIDDEDFGENNAILDYCTREDLSPACRIGCTTFNMLLTEEASRALLNNERLYEKIEPKEIYLQIVNGKKYILRQVDALNKNHQYLHLICPERAHLACEYKINKENELELFKFTRKAEDFEFKIFKNGAGKYANELNLNGIKIKKPDI